MKKLILSLGAGSLAFAAPVAFPTAAVAAPNTGILAICKVLVAEGDYSSVGECARYAAEVCNQAKKEGLFPLDLGDGTILKNQGECVNYVKSFYNE
jgi:hypothetical protein